MRAVYRFMGFNAYSSPRPYCGDGCAGGAVMSAARVRPNDACAQCGLLILSGARRHPLRLYCGQLDGAAAVTPPLTPRQFSCITHFRVSRSLARSLALSSSVSSAAVPSSSSLSSSSSSSTAPPPRRAAAVLSGCYSRVFVSATVRRRTCRRCTRAA